MAELANCMNCDTVFVKNIRDICQTCYKVEEEAFEIVYRFLMKRKNREATMDDIIEETGVDEKLIIKFIKEKRLRLSQFPKLAYPCESCGKDITTGNICNSCTQSFRNDLEKHDKMTERQKQAELAEQKKENVYYSYDKNRE